MDSGTGALTYRIASFDGNLADGSEEGQELLTSYAELVEGIHLLPFDESGETQAKELYVGQDFLLEARPVNENATVKAFRFTVENQQPAEEGGDVASIALLDGNKVEVSALGAGTAEILVSATDGSGMEKRLTVTVRQDTILADPKTIGRVVKHVSANGSFSFTVSMSVSLERMKAAQWLHARLSQGTMRRQGSIIWSARRLPSSGLSDILMRMGRNIQRPLTVRRRRRKALRDM